MARHRVSLGALDFTDLGDGGPRAALVAVEGLDLFHKTATCMSTVATVIGFLAKHLQRQITLKQDTGDVTDAKMAWIREVAGATPGFIQDDACQGFIAWRVSPPPKNWQESPGHPYMRVVRVTLATHKFVVVYRDHLSAKPGQDTTHAIIAVPTYGGTGKKDVGPFGGLTPDGMGGGGVISGLAARQVWERRDTSVRIHVNTMPDMGHPVVPVAALFKDATFVDTLRVAEATAVQAMARPSLVLGESAHGDAVVSRTNIIPDPSGRSMKDALSIQQQRNRIQVEAVQDAVESNGWGRPTADGRGAGLGGLVRFENPALDTVTLEAPHVRFDNLQRATVLPTGSTVVRAPEPRQPSNVHVALEALQKAVCAQFHVPSSVLFAHTGSGGKSTGASDVAQDGLFRTVDHAAEWMQTMLQGQYDACVRPTEEANLKQRAVAAGRLVELETYRVGVTVLAANLGAVRTHAAVLAAAARRPAEDSDAVLATDDEEDQTGSKKAKAGKGGKKKETTVDVPGWIPKEQQLDLQSKAATEALRGLAEFTQYRDRDSTEVLVHRMQKSSRVMELLADGYLKWEAGKHLVAVDMGLPADSLVDGDPRAERMQDAVKQAAEMSKIAIAEEKARAEIQIRTAEALAKIQAKYAPAPAAGAGAAAEPKPAAEPTTKSKSKSKPASAAKPSADGDDKASKLREKRDDRKADRREVGRPEPRVAGKRPPKAAGGDSDDPTAMKRGAKRVRV